jgi:hypothetical protein
MANKGSMDAAALEEAMNKATMSGISTQAALQDAPSAAILKNIQNAQTINSPIATPTADDIGESRKEIMGEDADKKAPDPIQQQQIMARAKEKATDRLPKFDPKNPNDWLMQQTHPMSNKDADIYKYQAIYGSRENIANNRNMTAEDIAKQKLDWDREKTGITETGKNNRTAVTAGAASGNGGVPFRNLSKAVEMTNTFNKSMAGSVLLSNPKMLQNPQYSGLAGEAVNYYNQLGRISPQDGANFYKAHAKDLEAAGHPLNPPSRAPQSVEPSPEGQGPQAPAEAPKAAPKAPAPQASGQNADGSIDMPDEDHSAQLRGALAKDVRGVVDSVTNTDTYKGIAAGVKGAAETIMGDGNPQPLINIPRRMAPDGKTQVQKYSDGKWYPAGRKVVMVGGKAYGVGGLVQIADSKFRVREDGLLEKAQ